MRWLWPIPVAAFVIYPYLKRFTWLCHLWLGAVDALAPVGGWVAVTGKLPWEAWVLGAAVGTWVAGLRPLLLAVRRRDRPRAGAALVGRRASASAACSWARGCCTSLTVVLPRRGRARPRRWTRGTGSACWRWRVLLAYEHTLVRPGDLRRLDAAFFTMNGVISVVFFAFVLLDVL